MRRVVILLLAIVLPLKALAAAVVPIVGVPEHHHAAHAAAEVAAATQDDGHAHAACAGMSDQSPAAADTLHDHACPHLAMATVTPTLPVLDADGRGPLAVPTDAQRPLSVILDLAVPPPTRQS